MKKNIKIDDLKVGMFVDLPYSWFKKIFTESEYMLESQEQIDYIKSKGIRQVLVDMEKSKLQPAKLIIQPSFEKEVKSPVKTLQPQSKQVNLKPITTKVDIPLQQPKIHHWVQEKFSAEKFKELVTDKQMAPEFKAALVYKDSVKLVNQLLDDPTHSKIAEGKKSISLIVDLILKDDVASSYLLSITNHDSYTYTHSVNVGILSIMLCKELFKHSDAHNLHEMGAGFFLHDIGKTQISKELINSPDKLNELEIEQIRMHPLLGYNILKETRQLTLEAKHIVLEHHERDDGRGYPLKLQGEAIHLYGKICCIADVYDALTTQRSYKPAFSPFESLKIMKTEMLAHFHQELFNRFVLLFSK